MIAKFLDSRFPALRSFLSRRVERIQFAALAVIAAALLLVKLGTGALLDWDEAIYAEVSKEMVSSHHWLTLTWQHSAFFEKPPLSFWIQAAFFQWFGVSEFWARFASALAGVAVVLLTYAIARRMAGPTAALFAGFILLTTNHFDRVVREGTTDGLLCLCIYLAIYAYVRLREGETVWFYLLCGAVGAGAMVKGPAILVAPLAVGIDWLFRKKSERILAWRECCLGGLLALAIAAPWHLWMVFKYGRSFLDSYIGYQLAARATGVIEGSSGGPLYYVRVIAAGAFPWSIVALFAVFMWLWRREWKYSLLWELMGVILLYSLMPTKHQWYTLPIYPALAIEVGRLLEDASRRWRVALYASIALLTVGIILAFARLAIRQGDPVTNQMARLARVAGQPPETGTLFILTAPESQSDIDTPAATFYSNRNAKLLEMPTDAGKITDSLKGRTSIDAILQKNAAGYVSQLYDVHAVAQSDLLLYAVISRKP